MIAFEEFWKSLATLFSESHLSKVRLVVVKKEFVFHEQDVLDTSDDINPEIPYWIGFEF